MAWDGLYATIISPIFMLCVATIFISIGIIVGLIVLKFYIAEEDKGIKTSTLSKIIFLLCFACGVLTVFLLPISIFARVSKMSDWWYTVEGIIYLILFVFLIFLIVFVVPFGMCYYEGEASSDSRSASQCCLDFFLRTLKGTLFGTGITIVLLVAFFCTYFFLGKSEFSVDVQTYPSSLSFSSLEEAFVASATQSKCISAQCGEKSTSFSVTLNPIVFAIALIVFCGYFLFVIIGGAGMAALPIKQIVLFIKRPKPLSKEKYDFFRKEYQQKTEKLIEIGQKMDEKLDNDRFNNPALFQDFQSESRKIIREWKVIDNAFKNQGGSIILPFFHLFYSIVSAIFSALLLIHMVLYVAIRPIFSFSFLNIVFVWLDSLTFGYPIFGLSIYIMFVFHLVMCVFSGLSEFLSSLPIITIYPLIPHDTLLNSLLFNVELFLVTSLTVNQFCAFIFEDYSHLSVINVIFGLLVQNLKMFSVIFDYVAKYGFFACFLIGFFYVLIFNLLPKKKTADEKTLSSLEKGMTSPFYTCEGAFDRCCSCFSKKKKSSKSDSKLTESLITKNYDNPKSNGSLNEND